MAHGPLRPLSWLRSPHAEHERAGGSVKTILEGSGMPAADVDAALERLDAAKPGEVTQVADRIAVRHGSVDAFALPLRCRLLPVRDTKVLAEGC